MVTLINTATDTAVGGATIINDNFTELDDRTSGAIDFGAATSFEVPNGAGGTTIDAAGEVCVDTTLETLHYHDGTEERVIDPEKSFSITIESPGSAEDLSLFRTNKAITISKVVAVSTGTTPSTTFQIVHGTDRNASGSNLFSSGQASTGTTTGDSYTTFSDATVVADSFVWLETSATSGTIDSINITIFFNVDA